MRSGGPSRWVKSGTTGSTPVDVKPERLELLPVVFRIAEREIDRSTYAVSSRRPRKHELDEILVDADEVSGGVMLW